MLGEYQQSSHYKHKEFVLKQIRRIQDEKLRVSKRIDAMELSAADLMLYYELPLTAKVHMLLTTSRYATSPNTIAARLGIGPEQLERELSKLIQLGILVRNKSKLELKNRNLHLDERHPLSK